MKTYFVIIVYFLLFNALGLSFYFFAPSFVYKNCISLLFFTALWLFIHSAYQKAIQLKIDVVSASLALHIGVKFLASLFFVVLLYYQKTFVGLGEIALFTSYYFIYTFLMLKYK